mgnify:CR=1 FL=1
MLVYGAIDAGKDDAAGDQYKGNLRFYTNQNSTGVPLERMRIDSSGHIIAGPFGGNSNAVIRGSSSPGYTNQPGTNLLLKSGDGSGTGSSFMSFYTSPAGSSGTSVNTAQERMKIMSNGNIRVGGGGSVDSANTQFNMEFPATGGINFGSGYTFSNIYGDASGSLYLKANAYPANTGSASTITLQTSNSGGGTDSPVTAVSYTHLTLPTTD